MAVPVLRLKRGEERRIRSGHLWVYSNEVDTAATPLKVLAPGGEVVVEDSRGKPLGRAYANPHSLICARLFSRDPNQSLDRAFLEKQIAQAVSLRESLFAGGCYRAVFGDGDGLSGLVIDRFNDTFVIQSGTAGMDAVLEDIAQALDRLYQPKNIVVKSESAVREQEGLSSMVQALKGELPAEVLLNENGVNYYAPLEEGQKTGWFYDHRAARRRILPLVAGARVLDVFSYCGAWGVLAAAHGASSVTCVDSSARAMEFVQRNAELNGVADRMITLAMEANAAMKELILQGQRFDVVVIDPPAFIKRKKDFKNGLAGYHAINELAMRLVEPGGVLVSASCSMHLSRDQLMDVVRSSGRHIDRFVQVFATEGQAEDHPIHPAIPETEYLKSVFARVLMNP
ncbi:class I SAM-dependent rRNA methyltransferase [Alcanivorax sp. 1008]|uniref:class I SAM-dependent rRNA methyltransferase n=1 Tax=Alcanivorax sp. 1008 TaxID=2816853 RepID=UPI001DAB8463|nr:class I SAM-dependent rRNA methyltransferase [Alcanivorax sp. 1008]MCC1497430.1 class I SAM-dependent rRNA methyltransferase [Alcanivorax sp. 1008]